MGIFTVLSGFARTVGFMVEPHGSHRCTLKSVCLCELWQEGEAYGKPPPARPSFYSPIETT
ncbi:hypothetical protein EBN78_22650 [Salmonella enterica]|nr:hypothetical protein [Salmonella enterica]MHA89560.1 hypothetical protein [Salmonella enterica]MKT26021.1 hypothetical protein [Salmonella enterica]